MDSYSSLDMVTQNDLCSPEVSITLLILEYYCNTSYLNIVFGCNPPRLSSSVCMEYLYRSPIATDVTAQHADIAPLSSYEIVFFIKYCGFALRSSRSGMKESATDTVSCLFMNNSSWQTLR